jgi:hypothetical protein
MGKLLMGKRGSCLTIELYRKNERTTMACALKSFDWGKSRLTPFLTITFLGHAGHKCLRSQFHKKISCKSTTLPRLSPDFYKNSWQKTQGKSIS